jgi:hypothetical protein
LLTLVDNPLMLLIRLILPCGRFRLCGQGLLDLASIQPTMVQTWPHHFGWRDAWAVLGCARARMLRSPSGTVEHVVKDVAVLSAYKTAAEKCIEVLLMSAAAHFAPAARARASGFPEVRGLVLPSELSDGSEFLVHLPAVLVIGADASA